MARKAENLIGRRFGYLEVVERASNEKSRHARWLCRCDCGNDKVVAARHLKSGDVRSCGCYFTKVNIECHTTHGDTDSLLYGVWQSMKQRCYNVSSQRYARYGKRGIIVCREWLNDYECFKEWAIKNGYENGLSIDRIDNDGNYEPSNCKWSTPKEQANNRSNNKIKF